MPWYVVPLVSVALAVVLLWSLRNVVVAVLVYCVLPLSSLLLRLFFGYALTGDWTAIVMLLLGVFLFLYNRLPRAVA